MVRVGITRIQNERMKRKRERTGDGELGERESHRCIEREMDRGKSKKNKLDYFLSR